MNKHKSMKRLARERAGRITAAAWILLAVVSLCLLPALLAGLLASPKIAGGAALAFFPLCTIRRDIAAGDTAGGGGGTARTELSFEDNVLGLLGDLEKRTETAKSDRQKFVDDMKALQTDSGKLKETCNGLTGELQKLQRSALLMPSRSHSLRQRGQISDECALSLAGSFILHCERSGKLEAFAGATKNRDGLLDIACKVMGIEAKTAISTTDIPLPTQYAGEIRELISEFGVVRKAMFPYPIGMGTARPARMGTRPAFGSIAMSGAFTEKSPTITFASLESHKIGGLVRLPREIDEQSIVVMGQFLARYGAIEFARAEDVWGFLADGTGTYEQVKGIVQIARDNGNTVVLGAGKTKPSDATRDDLRALRRKVNKAALSGKLSAYYFDSTWETRLRDFNTKEDMWVYIRLPDGSATFDGYPIVWTDTLPAFATTAAADSAIAVFGALSFWWMGEHGNPRIDTSEDVFFANDQLAVRFIEEIDFDYAAVDATAALLTAAA